LKDPYRFPRCPNCMEQVIPNSSGCHACGVTFGSPLLAGENADPDPGLLKPNDLTRISLGLSPRWRTVGWVVSVVFAVFVIGAFAVYLTTPDPTDSMVLVLSLGSLASAYDVWAFTHGKRTTIFIFRPDRKFSTHDATSVNTSWRLFGLLLDVAVMTACIWVFLSKL
jgi:hypothetical protein